MKPQAVLYARYSPRPTMKGGPKPMSNETQLSLCAEHALKKGYEVRPEWQFQDEMVSGASDLEDRPNLWLGIEALKRGGVLLVYKSDRLARDVAQAHLIAKAVMKKKCRVEAVVGGILADEDMTPEDQLKIGLLRLVDQYERQMISARTKAALTYRQSIGKLITNKVPWYGTEEDPERPGFVRPNQEEVEQIETMLELATEEDMSPWQIANEMKKMGLKARGGKEWHRTKVNRIWKRMKRLGMLPEGVKLENNSWE